jgi:2-oxoglutarate dehydrogenase E2 component (dihydrolipoamide succinyltransferase)
MTTQITAPSMGESISEATVAQWMKKEGDFVEEDELIAELETDKVNLEVTAPAAGKLASIKAGEGATVAPGDVMGEIDESAKGEAAPATPEQKEQPTPTAEPAEEPPAAAPAPASGDRSGPAAQKAMREQGLSAEKIQGTGKDGRITKADVHKAAQGGTAPTSARTSGERETREPMSRIRKTIATRLKTAQNTAAMLTTYNEIDLFEVNKLRKTYKEKFQDAHGVKLGYMSFFTKAVVDALKAWPALNAEVDGEELVYKHYYDIGIAVASPRGLVVPVVREADQKSFAQIEADIMDFALRARDGKLMPDDLAGATFSITNGGTFGSMLSMPILNYPQVGILGMHAIKERPMVVNGEITIRPVMYVALTYDHRIVDGREAVSFLVKIKDALENPGRMLLGV